MMTRKKRTKEIKKRLRKGKDHLAQAFWVRR